MQRITKNITNDVQYNKNVEQKLAVWNFPPAMIDKHIPREKFQPEFPHLSQWAAMSLPTQQSRLSNVLSFLHYHTSRLVGTGSRCI